MAGAAKGKKRTAALDPIAWSWVHTVPSKDWISPEHLEQVGMSGNKGAEGAEEEEKEEAEEPWVGPAQLQIGWGMMAPFLPSAQVYGIGAFKHVLRWVEWDASAHLWRFPALAMQLGWRPPCSRSRAKGALRPPWNTDKLGLAAWRDGQRLSSRTPARPPSAAWGTLA
jgi:hypothetical protein